MKKQQELFNLILNIPSNCDVCIFNQGTNLKQNTLAAITCNGSLNRTNTRVSFVIKEELLYPAQVSS